MKTTVIYHSQDYDGLFCREIARKFLPDAELIGWDFPDKPLSVPEGRVCVMDLPVDRIFGFQFKDVDGRKQLEGSSHPLDRIDWSNFVWIDHHKSSIETHPTEIPGYRIDGVAACRLAWQWFSLNEHNAQNQTNEQLQIPLPTKQMFLDRVVSEPLAVRLAGEYDIWDHRGDGDLEFQFGLDCQPEIQWHTLLYDGDGEFKSDSSLVYIDQVIADGRAAMNCYAKRDADIMRERSFTVVFEGLVFLALNTARCNSNTFAARDVMTTGHDALCGFYWNGKCWNVSLYHAAHRKDLDLSLIAVKYGGGGHRGACGFRSKQLPFIEI